MLISVQDEEYVLRLEELYIKYGAKDYDIEDCNLVGVRNPEGRKEDIWNDVLIFYYRPERKLYLDLGTTDPGKYYIDNPMRRDGAAHLAEIFQKHIWSIGKHGRMGTRGRHTAFVQGGRAVSLWRDTNKDYKITQSDVYIEVSYGNGINMHSTYNDTDSIGKSSAGCQVWKDMNSLQKIINICKDNGQELFSYLLMPLRQENEFLYDLVI